MRASRLVYQQRAFSVMDDATRSSGVRIAYEGRTYDRMTKTFVIIWNVGGHIRASDVELTEPLRFEVSQDAEIVTALVAKAPDQSNVSVKRADDDKANAVTIHFDELGRGEGAVLEVLHTSSERFGIVRGAKDRGKVRPPFNPLPSQLPGSYKAVGTTAFVFIFGIGALLVLLSAVGSYLVPILGPHLASALGVIESVADVIYAGLAFMVLAQTRRRFPEDLTIPELAD